MAEFVTVPFDTQTPEEMQLAVFDHFQTFFPTWAPRSGQLEVAQAEVLTQIIFDLQTLAADVPPAIMTYLGTLIKINPIEAKPATVSIQFTCIDNAGHTVPADSVVAWDIGEDTGVGFTNSSPLVIPPGSTTGIVTMVCEQDGVIGNGFSGLPQIITQLDFLSSAVAIAPTAGGEDAESISDYLNRFSTRLQLLKDRPIRADQVATWVLTVIEGVERAICFDNYNISIHAPGDYAQTDERHITIVGMDDQGNNLTTGKKNEILAAIAITREVSFNFHITDPTRTQLDATAVVRQESGYDPVALASNIKQSIASAMSPLIWGLPTSAQGPSWLNERLVRNRWVYSLVDRVEGVRYVESDVLVGLHLGVQAATDITLPGLAPLPFINIADINVTVNPPL